MVWSYPEKKTTQLLVHGGSAAVNRGADCVQYRDYVFKNGGVCSI
jgi:hypothetical protein